MLIQAAADFHGKEKRYRAFFSDLDENNPDVVVIAGDIEADSLFFKLLDRTSVPIIIVHGNMDSISIGEEVERHGNSIFLHEKIFNFGGVNFAGAGGGSPSPDAFYHINGKKAVPVEEAKIDVLVTHVPPKGVMDKMALGFHIGNEWVRHIMEEKKPRLVICGHVHEDSGYEKFGDTTVVNCSVGRRGKYSLIEMDGDIKVDMR